MESHSGCKFQQATLDGNMEHGRCAIFFVVWINVPVRCKEKKKEKEKEDAAGKKEKAIIRSQVNEGTVSYDPEELTWWKVHWVRLILSS